MNEQDQQSDDDQADGGDGGKRPGEFRIGNAREAADHDVLGIAGDGRGAADVGRHGERQQIGQGPAAHGERRLGHQRRQHQADRVVDQEGGEQARDQHHADQQQSRAMGMLAHPGGGELEEPRQAQMGDDDHHAQQQGQRVEVDGLIGLLEGERAARHHQAGAEKGGAGAVEPQPRRAPERDHHISGEEDQRGDQHESKSARRLPIRGSSGDRGSGSEAPPRLMAAAVPPALPPSCGRRGSPA